MKRFACQDIIPGCDHVFTGADDQSVLDQVIAHAAAVHGLVKPPLALVELVVATTRTMTPATPARGMRHLRLVGAQVSATSTPEGLADHPNADCSDDGHVVSTIPSDPVDSLNGGVVTIATDRFRPGGEDIVHPDPARGVSSRSTLHGEIDPDTADETDRAKAALASIEFEPPAAVHRNYRHECVMYSGIDGLLAALIPFITDGLERNQPIMVAVIEPRLRAIRRALGDDAGRVGFVDMAELGHNPARIIPAWRDFVARCDGRPMRGVGEPIWAGRREAEIIESQLHEALLNVAVDPDTPLWLLCPYDVTALDGGVIGEALRSHPVVSSADPASPDPARDAAAAGRLDYGGIDHVLSLFAADLPTPTDPTATVALRASNDTDIAGRVMNYATAAGLPTRRSAKLASAVDEIAAAGVHHSAGDVDIRFWRQEAALVCEVADRGVISDPMVGRGTTLAAHSRDRGIRLANELCDLVQVRSGSSGTTVRVLSWL